MAVLALACARDAAPIAATGHGISTLAPAPVDYSARGPYPVGMMILDAGATKAVVYYPADPATLDSSRHVTSYNLGDALTPALRAYLGPVVPELVQDIPLDVHQSASINPEGPFPIVVHSHGVGGSPMAESAHFQHLASWGFVVAAPDHQARDLTALATGAVVADGSDDRDLRATLDALSRENTRPGSPLLTGLDTTSVAAEGLDDGAATAYRLAAEDRRVRAWIGQAPTALGPPDGAAPAPLEKAMLIIAGEKDSLVPVADVQARYDALGAPKRLAIVHGAGHSTFLDACAPLRRSGGLGTYAANLPALIPILERNDDGCAGPDAIEPARASAYIDHLTVASYRRAFGLDTDDASVREDFLRRTFPEAAGPIQSTPAP